jgi:hypothetical protein
MNRSRLTIMAFALLASLFLPYVVGCGGGGGTSSPNSGGSGSETVSLTNTRNGTAMDLDWVAFQDGYGTWQYIKSSGTGEYRAMVTDPQGYYAFAYVKQDHIGNGYNKIRVIYATTAETRNIVDTQLDR